MRSLIRALVAVLAIMLLLVVSFTMAAMIVLLTLYDRLRAFVVPIAFPARAAREREDAYRHDLVICNCLLIDGLLRDNLVSHADVCDYLDHVHEPPPWQEVLEYGVQNGWLIQRDEWWAATEPGVKFADEYNRSIR